MQQYAEFAHVTTLSPNYTSALHFDHALCTTDPSTRLVHPQRHQQRPRTVEICSSRGSPTPLSSPPVPTTPAETAGASVDTPAMAPIKLKISLSGLAARTQQQPAVADRNGGPVQSRESTSRTTPAPADSVAMSRVTSDGSDGYSSSQSGPGPSTIRLTLGKGAAATPSSTSTQTPTPSYTPVSTPGAGDGPRRRVGRRPSARPSAIPAHLSAPPRSPAYARSPPGRESPTPDAQVKLERFDDDLDIIGSHPGSPTGWGVYTPHGESSSATPGWRENSIDTPGSRGPAKWKRIRRPFKELANKVLLEMRRKDEYGFFLDPGG